MRPETRDALVAALDGFDPLVEVGIGRRPDVAGALAAAGREVTATDVVERSVPANVRFVRDDVTDPTPAVYADAEAVYALNLPPELQRSAWLIAREHGAAFQFTTLGGDPVTVPATPRRLPGETLFVAADCGPPPGRGRN